MRSVLGSYGMGHICPWTSSNLFEYDGLCSHPAIDEGIHGQFDMTPEQRITYDEEVKQKRKEVHSAGNSDWHYKQMAENYDEYISASTARVQKSRANNPGRDKVRQADRISKAIEDKQFWCEPCQLPCGTKQRLENHQKTERHACTVAGSWAYWCKPCNKGIANLSNLTRHEKTETHQKAVAAMAAKDAAENDQGLDDVQTAGLEDDSNLISAGENDGAETTPSAVSATVKKMLKRPALTMDAFITKAAATEDLDPVQTLAKPIFKMPSSFVDSSVSALDALVPKKTVTDNESVGSLAAAVDGEGTEMLLPKKTKRKLAVSTKNPPTTQAKKAKMDDVQTLDQAQTFEGDENVSVFQAADAITEGEGKFTPAAADVDGTEMLPETTKPDTNAFDEMNDVQTLKRAPQKPAKTLDGFITRSAGEKGPSTAKAIANPSIKRSRKKTAPKSTIDTFFTKAAVNKMDVVQAISHAPQAAAVESSRGGNDLAGVATGNAVEMAHEIIDLTGDDAVSPSIVLD